MGHRLLISLSLVLLTAFRSIAAGSPFRFDSGSWDWGVIREADGPVTHAFRFVNTSAKPVCIWQVNVACGCTRVEWSREPVAPGKSAEVTVAFNPKDYKGRVSKTISVRNSENTADVLTVSCTVIPVEKPLEVAFPVLLDCGIRLSSEHLNFGQIRQGESRMMKLGIANASDKRRIVTVAPEGRSGLLAAVSPLVLEPGARDSLMLTFSLDGHGCHYGVVEDTVVLSCGRGRCGKVAVSMIGTEAAPLDHSDGGPKLRVSSQYENLGSVSRDGGPVRKAFEISNIGNRELILRDIHAPSCIEAVLDGPMSVEPGGKRNLTIILHPELTEKSRIFETVHVTANDAEHPVREIMIAATIK